MPHQIVVGPDGLVWVVDVGLHQAIEFDADGEKLRTNGGPKVRFTMPTDLAILADRAIVVSDGYVDSRAVTISSDGKLLAAWGTKGAQPLQFNVPAASPSTNGLGSMSRIGRTIGSRSSQPTASSSANGPTPPLRSPAPGVGS